MYGIFAAFVREVLSNPRATDRTLIRRALTEYPLTRKHYVAGTASGAIFGPYDHLLDRAIELDVLKYESGWQLGPRAWMWADIWWG